MPDLKARLRAAVNDSPKNALTLIRTTAATEELDSSSVALISSVLDQISPSVFYGEGYVPKKVAVLSGYTFEPFRPWLRLQLLVRGINVSFWISDYGLYEQAVYSSDDLRLFSPDICYLFVGREHLEYDGLEREIQKWSNLWRGAYEALHCDLVVNDFELPEARPLGNYEVKHPESRSNYVIDLNRALARIAPSYVHFHSVSALAGFYGMREWRDNKLYDMAKIPVSAAFWPVYAESVAAVIGALYGKSKKCLVVDLDNTLWGGVVGEEGVARIEIGPHSAAGEAYSRFQKCLKALKDRGILLAVCSKNDLATAQEPFLKHSDMVLGLEDFSYFCANWQPKDQNLVAIADALNIGLDSIVFVDDSPVERELVRRSLPEVTVIDLPEDPSEYAREIGRSVLFEPVTLTAEDLERHATYKAARERETLRAQVSDYAEYLRSLEMVGAVMPADELHLPRILQLINKTNQFNLTTRRYTEAQLREFLADPQVVCRFAKLSDRFGNYGVISVYIAIARPPAELEVDTWLMSCRVLKRGVERFIFRSLLEEARRRGLQRIRGRYIPTAKNAMVSTLYQELGFTCEQTCADGSSCWMLDLSDREHGEDEMNQPIFVGN